VYRFDTLWHTTCSDVLKETNTCDVCGEEACTHCNVCSNKTCGKDDSKQQIFTEYDCCDLDHLMCVECSHFTYCTAYEVCTRPECPDPGKPFICSKTHEDCPKLCRLSIINFDCKFCGMRTVCGGCMHCFNEKCSNMKQFDNEWYDNKKCQDCGDSTQMHHPLQYLLTKNRGMNNSGYPLCVPCFVSKMFPSCEHKGTRMNLLTRYIQKSLKQGISKEVMIEQKRCLKRLECI
jgi:hypothetical protein